MAGPEIRRDAGHIWYDGQLVPWPEARIHVLTHGLHYGSAVFEGERIYGGRVFKQSEHSRRLIASAGHIGIACPFDAALLDKATETVVRVNALRDGYVRPLCWLGDEEINVAGRACSVHVAIAAWEWPHAFDARAKAQGIRLALSPWRRPPPTSAPHQAKAAGVYLLGMMSRRAAEAEGYDDALLLDHRGLVAEATGANLFIVKDRRVITPIPDCFLDGITRRTVIGLARTLGYTVEERHVTVEQLRAADEVFLTGTAYEITPVRAIVDLAYPVGDVTQMLIGAFDRLVRREAMEPVAAGP
jgi:branched-chain amino acid aminotransferase